MKLIGQLLCLEHVSQMSRDCVQLRAAFTIQPGPPPLPIKEISPVRTRAIHQLNMMFNVF